MDKTFGGEKYNQTWTENRNVAIKIDASNDDSGDDKNIDINTGNVDCCKCNNDSVEIAMTSQGAGPGDDDKHEAANSSKKKILCHSKQMIIHNV